MKFFINNFSKVSITLALLTTSSYVNFASAADANTDASSASAPSITALTSIPSQNSLVSVAKADADLQVQLPSPVTTPLPSLSSTEVTPSPGINADLLATNAPRHQYKLIRDSSHPNVTDKLSVHPSVQQGKALLSSFIRVSRTFPSSYFFDIREGIPFKGLDNSQKILPPYDEGNIGSCSANALATALRYRCILQDMSSESPSRLHIYHNQRSLIGSNLTEDTGATISSGIAATITYGACPESLFSYEGEGEKFMVKPPKQCYETALSAKGLQISAAANIPQDGNILVNIKKVLHNQCPIVMGIKAYASFEAEETTKTGIVPMPKTETEQVLGNRALVIMGYNDAKQRFTVRNSWGNTCGNQGDYYLPYAYITPDLSFDFWFIGKVGAKIPVTFSVTANTNHGQSVYVVGDAAELGNWDPTKAFQLSCTPQTYPNWSGSTTLSTSQLTEYKFFKSDGKSKPIWFEGANFSFTPTLDNSLVKCESR